MPSSSTRTPFGMRRVFVETPRGRIVCLRNQTATPAPRPAAVMVNGLVESKERWSPALVHMGRAGYDAYAFDHIGQFESDGPDDPERYTVDTLADDLLAVLDEISPDRAAHVVGGCFGGFVARRLLAQKPHRFQSLVLLGSGPSLATSTRPELHHAMASLMARGGITAVFEEVRAHALRSGISERSVRRVQASYLATRPGFLLGFSQSVADFPDESCPSLPLLVAHGSEDGMWTASAQRTMARQLGAPLEVVSGAGHSPTVTHPRGTAEVLTRFWAQADADAPRTELDLSPA